MGVYQFISIVYTRADESVRERERDKREIREPRLRRRSRSRVHARAGESKEGNYNERVT